MDFPLYDSYILIGISIYSIYLLEYAQKIQHSTPQIVTHPCSLMLSLHYLGNGEKYPTTDKQIIKGQYIFTMEYYSVVKEKNKILSFAAKWMELEKYTD